MFFSPGAPRSPRLDPGSKIELWIGGGGGRGGGEGESADQQQGEHLLKKQSNHLWRTNHLVTKFLLLIVYKYFNLNDYFRR